MTLEERREYKAAREKERRARLKEEALEAMKPTYPAAVRANEKSAKAIIANAWGIKRAHIIDTVYQWGCQAAEELKLTKNDFFWANGPRAASTGEAIAKLSDECNIVVGEVTYKRELFAIYIFVEQWRPQAIATFDEYLGERRQVKRGGTINRGNKYFGMDFHEKPHARWDEMYVQWNPDLLKPDYDREDVKKWLGSLSEDKRRLLIACRSAYKSTFSLCFLVAGILCCPDIRLLFVTETRPLSLEFLKSFVHFFEITNPNDPSRFNRLFAEFCVGTDETVKDLFQSPMSILGLPQPTCKTTSMESGGWAGNRADYILVSDAISSNTVGTDAQIQKSVDNAGAITELLEVGGYLHFEGTPWHENDLYAQLLERNQRAEGKNLLYILDPAWRVLPSGEGKAVQELEEGDVDLLFPARLTWKVLQAKLLDDDPPYRRFRMQSLCMFLPEVEETQKLHFRRDDLTRNSLDFSMVPKIPGRTVASGDLAFSKSRYADMSCFTIMETIESKLYVLEQRSGRWNDTEKAVQIVELYRKYPDIDTWIIERYPTCENLEAAIQLEARKYGLTVPVRFPKDKANSADAKFHRLKGIESIISQNRIKFVFGIPGVSNEWIDDLFDELERLDDTTPKRRSSSVKDDRGDSLAIGIRYFMPSPDDEDAAAREKLDAEEASRRAMRNQYDRIFNGGGETNVTTGRQWRNGLPTPESPSLDDVGENVTRGPFGIPGLRNWSQPRQDSSKKPMSFGDLQQKHFNNQ